MTAGRAALATLLRHEAKANSYKFALVRALNDLALEHPLVGSGDVIVPLRRVAERWLVHYWGFVGEPPVYQGARAMRGAVSIQDLSFRPRLTALRAAWEALPYTRADAAQGALLLAEYRAGRGRLPPEVQQFTEKTIRAIMQAVRQPVKYAGGPIHHALFSAPAPAASLRGSRLPGTTPADVAFVVPRFLWQTLQALSLWVEALCLHEWSLHVERVQQDPPVSRGQVFALLTTPPEGRVPLGWERHQVRLLMLGGLTFHCPWTGCALGPEGFALDHLIPVSTFPINELWNLLPSDPSHNSHVKRQRIPEAARLGAARPFLEETYRHYGRGAGTGPVLGRDVLARFGGPLGSAQLTERVIHLTDAVAQSRNAPRY